MSRPFSFLITGGSSGLGLNLALAALRSGHRVMATARNPTKAKQASPEVEKLGGSWLELDVTSRTRRALRGELLKRRVSMC
jgi:NAD(P)-dependent dehydrogenase (short-subunit alcohol dehydrogenase family)